MKEDLELKPHKASALTKEEKVAKIQEILDQSTGSQTFYRHPFGITYTEGVHAIAEVAGAHWLIDVVASYQSTLRRTVSAFSGEKGIPFQIWRLVVDVEKQTCVVTCHEDWSDEEPGEYPAVVRQEIEYTDFPAPYLRLYCEDGGGHMVLLVLNEH